MKQICSTIYASYVIEDNKIIDSIEISKNQLTEHATKLRNGEDTDSELKLQKKHKCDIKIPNLDVLDLISQNFQKYKEYNTLFTKRLIKSSVTKDQLIIQTTNNLLDLDKVINTMVKRLRDWYALYNPEFSDSIQNQEKFTELVLEDKSKLLKKLKLDPEYVMGADLEPKDIKQIQKLAKTTIQLYKLQEDHKKYLETLMKKICPNLLDLAGLTIGAKLIVHARNLQRLSFMPASTVQLLGAEKALFRHLKTGARSPKYGLIFNHPLISKSRNKGKMARILAERISFAVRIDVYGEDKTTGKKYLKELEKLKI